MSVGVLLTSIGAIPIMNSGPVTWTFTEGFAPNIADYEIRPVDAVALNNLDPEPVTLVLRGQKQPNGGESNELRVTNLWIDRVLPGENPFVFRVRLKDRRWFFTRQVVMRRYNHRRAIGFERIKNNADDTLNPVEPKFQFAVWSLKDEIGASDEGKWKITEMFIDSFERVADKEEEFNGTRPTLEITSEVTAMDPFANVEGVTAKGQGDEALQEIKKRIPEAAFWCDKDGVCRLFSRAAGDEDVEAAKLGPEHVGKGHLLLVDNSQIRASKIRVHFPREVELRFDFNEVGDRVEDTRSLDNVLSYPDFEGEVAGVEVAQGTWTEFRGALVSFGAPPGLGGTQLALKTIQTAFVPFLDLWAGLAQLGIREPDIDWQARVAEIQSAYRQKFQIDKRYWDRILSVEDKRVGIVNVSTGGTGPAEAFANYVYMGTTRSMYLSLLDAALNPDADIDMSYAMNVKAFDGGDIKAAIPEIAAGDPGGPQSAVAATKRAPADITILDPQQGVFSIRFQSDKNRLYEMVLPGLLVNQDEQELGPTSDAADAVNRPVSFDAVTTANQIPKLSKEWKMSVILTCVPAAPNNERQLEVVEVEPNDVKDNLPPGAQRGIDRSNGPIYDVFVEGGLQGATAMIRWKDDRAADIDAIFGLGDAEPDLEGLVLNKKPQSQIVGLQAPSLNAIAQTIAAGIWAGQADRLQGSATFDLNQNTTMRGWIQSIVHSLQIDGPTETSISTPEMVPRMSNRANLDPSTRAILDREIVPKKK